MKPRIFVLHEAVHFGIRSGNCGFDFNGISNQTANIESMANLSQPIWQSIQTDRK